MSENNESSNDSIRLGSGNPLIRAGVLRPSVLGSSLNHSNSAGALADSKLKEPTLNPFLKAKDDDDDEAEVEGDCEAVPSTTKDDIKPSTNEKKTEPDEEEPDQRPDPLVLLRKNGIERTTLFAAATSIPRVENTGFVFGQNVHERVVGENVKPDSSSKSETADSTSGELLFSSVIQKSTKTGETDEGNGSTDTNNTTAGAEAKSLTEVAREYEESRAQKRKFEEVQTFTGEENEVNIVDISCKLFAFVNSNWEERGRGSLRLNDSKTNKECSRVVFRTSGNLRLLINTKVWAGMVAERPSQKSLRLTAMDNTGKIKVFLAQARPVEINQLHKALIQRIDKQQTSHPEECYTAAVDDSNGGGEQNISKNGATSNNDEIKIATTQDIPEEKTTDQKVSKNYDSDRDESAEPSPKKIVVETTETSN